MLLQIISAARTYEGKLSSACSRNPPLSIVELQSLSLTAMATTAGYNTIYH